MVLISTFGNGADQQAFAARMLKHRWPCWSWHIRSWANRSWQRTADAFWPATFRPAPTCKNRGAPTICRGGAIGVSPAISGRINGIKAGTTVPAFSCTAAARAVDTVTASPPARPFSPPPAPPTPHPSASRRYPRRYPSPSSNPPPF